MRVMRVCLQTVGLIHHTPLAICRLEASDTREVAAEVFGSGGELKGPLHGVKQRFHILKSRFSEVTGKMTWPYCRLVVLYLAAENGGMTIVLEGQGELATQWCSGARSLGGQYVIEGVG